MSYVMTTHHLSKRYGSKMALQDLNLQLPAGKIIGLLGPNGSGKTTLLKRAAGLLTPSQGHIEINGIPVGLETKAIVSYLPDRTYLRNNQRIVDQLDFFQDFYPDFDRVRAETMLYDLGIAPATRFGTLSKGNKEKVQLVLVMSRRAKLYLLDEPIGGVDPAAREYILSTIVSNYNPGASIIITTHLITDIEQVLDDFMFLSYGGKILCAGNAEITRNETGKSLDQLFKEVFKC